MMRVNWVALSIVSCLPYQPSSAAGAGTDTGGWEEGRGEQSSFGGQWEKKGDKRGSRSVSEMNDSYTDDKLNFALI